jgi:hypothetical protein
VAGRTSDGSEPELVQYDGEWNDAREFAKRYGVKVAEKGNPARKCWPHSASRTSTRRNTG